MEEESKPQIFEMTYEEKLFECYKELRRKMLDFDSFRYDMNIRMIESEEFKNGFLSGIKLFTSLHIKD